MRHVVERTVRLHVGDRGALAAREGLQRADLVGDKVFEIERTHPDLTAAEAPDVVEPRMSPDRDAIRDRGADRLDHNAWIAGVHAAGHVRGADHWHQRLVLPYRELAVALADVGIDVEPHVRLPRQGLKSGELPNARRIEPGKFAISLRVG